MTFSVALGDAVFRVPREAPIAVLREIWSRYDMRRHQMALYVVWQEWCGAFTDDTDD